MSLVYFPGWNFASIGTFSLEFTVNDGTFTAEITSGKYAHSTMATVMGSDYTAFSSALQTAMNATASARTFTVALSTASFGYQYTITPDAGTIVITNSTNTVAKNVLGFNSLPTGAAASISSQICPYYVIVPSVAARTSVSDDYEPGDLAYDAEADDGSSYGISRTSAPTYHDWKQCFESKAKTFIRSASTSVPWTYQHMFRHCRNVEPILVTDADGGATSDDMVVKLRAEGAVWHPERNEADYDGEWHVPFMTRVLGRQ